MNTNSHGDVVLIKVVLDMDTLDKLVSLKKTTPGAVTAKLSTKRWLAILVFLAKGRTMDSDPKRLRGRKKEVNEFRMWCLLTGRRLRAGILTCQQ